MVGNEWSRWMAQMMRFHYFAPMSGRDYDGSEILPQNAKSPRVSDILRQTGLSHCCFQQALLLLSFSTNLEKQDLSED